MGETSRGGAGASDAMGSRGPLASVKCHQVRSGAVSACRFLRAAFGVSEGAVCQPQIGPIRD